MRFAQEEIMSYCGESTFIQRETAETALDMIQYRAGREKVSTVALAYVCNVFTDKGTEEKKIC